MPSAQVQAIQWLSNPHIPATFSRLYNVTVHEDEDIDVVSSGYLRLLTPAPCSSIAKMPPWTTT